MSVGSIGSQAGWSSVVTRTEKGEEIYKGAIKAKLIEKYETASFGANNFLKREFVVEYSENPQYQAKQWVEVE